MVRNVPVLSRANRTPQTRGIGLDGVSCNVLILLVYCNKSQRLMSANQTSPANVGHVKNDGTSQTRSGSTRCANFPILFLISGSHAKWRLIPNIDDCTRTCYLSRDNKTSLNNLICTNWGVEFCDINWQYISLASLAPWSGRILAAECRISCLVMSWDV